jgi:hypothetical protein
VIQVTHRRGFDNATGTGELTSPTSAQPNARVSYVAIYPDAVGREQARADYGTNGGTALSRPAVIPARSDTVLVTATLYNSDGEAFKVIDPMGTITYREFDDAGRRTKLVENYQDPSSSSSSSSSSSAYAASPATGPARTDPQSRAGCLE